MSTRLIRFLTENKWKYRFHRTRARVIKDGCMCVGRGCRLVRSRIIVDCGSELRLGNNVVIEDCDIYIKGNATIGDYTILKGGEFTVESGQLIIGHHSKVTAKRIWVRFEGVASIGDYTNINEGSEIRCDEKVTIGSYNQISFNVRIWDTNTHNIYPAEKRRDITEKYWPYFGKEIERPKTSPVVIGDDCWIGENAAVLKGTTLGNQVIVGYGTLISGRSVEDGRKVVSHSELKII